MIRDRGRRTILRVATMPVLAVGTAQLLAACADKPYRDVDSSELASLIAQGVPLYDVRRPDEWRETGVIAGSRKLTFVDAQGRLDPGFLPRLLAEVPRDQPVAVVCRVGNRTRALAGLLTGELGYTKVYNVRDGIQRWIGDGRPVTRD